MRDYITTVFNLIVGLISADKIVYLALIGLGVVLVWQLIGLLTNFHRRFAWKCRKISKFLINNGLSANNYNNFLALIAKMPQEFIRGYKTFEHASYGLPSDYIKRFDSIDVEVNGGLLNHGKSMIKAVIYGWTIILSILSLALLGSDAALTGFALADALLVPVLFLILAKGLYFIFNAVKQQQYKMAVDEFNEMLDLMDEKIENNDNMPGPDVLSDLIESVPVLEDNTSVVNSSETNVNEKIQDEISNIEPTKIETAEVIELSQENKVNEPEVDDTDNSVYTEDELVSSVTTYEELNEAPIEIVLSEDVKDLESADEPAPSETAAKNEEKKTSEAASIAEKLAEYKNVTINKNTEQKDNEMEEKRGRGRPRKIEDGELVIKNDKQFEEVLLRAEKLMRKSEEALSASQAKRVEKSLKELIDAMTKYKEEH